MEANAGIQGWHCAGLALKPLWTKGPWREAETEWRNVGRGPGPVPRASVGREEPSRSALPGAGSDSALPPAQEAFVDCAEKNPGELMPFLPWVTMTLGQ